MITGLLLHRAGIALPANRQFQKLTAQNSEVRTPSTQSTKASPSPHSLISYSFLPFLFLGVLASIPTSCWHQKQEGSRVSSSVLQLRTSRRHACTNYSSEDRGQQNMRPAPVWFTGFWEERRQGSLLTFWSNTHHLQEPVWTSVWGQLVSLLRLMKQNLTKTASPATLHAAAWIENLTRLQIYLMVSHHTAHCYKPRVCAPVQVDGYKLSICQAAREPSLCALSFTQDLQSTLQSTLASSWKYFILQDTGFPRYKFLAKLYISLYYINERRTGTFSRDTAYCSQVVPGLVEGKSWHNKVLPASGEKWGAISQRLCYLSVSFGPHTLLIQYHLGNSLLKLHAHYHEWELWGLAHHSESP